MERLTARDLRGLLQFTADLHALDDLDALARHLLAALPRLVPVDLAAWTEVNGRGRRLQYLVSPAESDFAGARETFARHHREHPIYRHLRRTGDGSAMTISDFLTRREFHDLGLYQEFFRRAGVEYLLSAVVASPASLVVGLALCRARRDFSGRERQLVECLRPHLAQAYRTAEAATAARQESALARDGLESAGTGTLVLDERGRVRDLSDLGRRRVEAYFGAVRHDRLPAALAAWSAAAREGLVGEVPTPPRPLVVERDGTRLVVRLLRRPSRTLVLLCEERNAVNPEALGRFGLSRREAEVLAWVAEGKTNPEVAAILGLSARTVGNHLARIYTRLGVETRTAAARIALAAT